MRGMADVAPFHQPREQRHQELSRGVVGQRRPRIDDSQARSACRKVIAGSG